MKKLLLVTGDLAAGKSTFSEFLSRRYDTNAFHKDTIKEILGDTVGFSDREENLKLSHATMELMTFLCSEFVKQGKDLILESNFHTAELERLHRIAERNGYNVLTIVLRGDIATLHRRYLNRIYNENRHPVHLSTTFDVFEDFKAYIEHARQEEIPGEVLILSADDFSYQSDKEVLAKIDKFMETF